MNHENYYSYQHPQPPPQKNTNAIVIALLVFLIFLVILATAVFLFVYNPSGDSGSTPEPTATATGAPTATATAAPTEAPAVVPTTAPTVAPTPPPNTTVVGYRYVANVPQSVYLRKSPNESAGHYTTIPLGTMVGFIEYVNNFSKVSYNGTVGYVLTKYLSTVPPSVSYEPEVRTVCNVPYSIYLRSAPQENSNNIICEIPVGTRVQYLANAGNGFVKISYNGKIGYAKSQYLQ